MTARASQGSTNAQPELVASGLGFPEGPVAMPDGSLVCVDSYRGQLTIWAPIEWLVLSPRPVERPIPA